MQRRLLDALLDDEMLAAKRDQETTLRASVARDPKLSAQYGDPWARIEAAQKTEAAMLLPHTYLEDAAGFNSRLFRYARTLVRGAAERAKPNAERLREYRDAALTRVEQNLAGAAPIYPGPEEARCRTHRADARVARPDHHMVRRLLATGRPTRSRLSSSAAEAADPAVRTRSGTADNAPSTRRATR